jgi:uncharacterized protein (TIGR02231 family)
VSPDAILSVAEAETTRITPASEAVPVVGVTLTEDRATVRRSGVLELTAGAHTLVIPSVSPLAVEDSLRVQFGDDAAEVTRVELRRKWSTDAPVMPQPAAGLHDLTDTFEEQVWQAEADVRRAIDRTRHAFSRIDTVRRQLEHGALHGTIEPERVHATLDHITARSLHAVDRLMDHVDAGEALHDELKRYEDLVMSGVRKPNLTADLHIHFQAAAAGPATLSVSYLLPSALWRPAYEATLETDDAGQDHLLLRLVGAAWQRTGEAWDHIQVTLSTARPSVSSALPSLHHDVLHAREKTRAEAGVIDAEFRDQTIQTASLTGDTTEALPGVDDGGETRVFTVERPANLPSDGRAHRLTVAEMKVAADCTRLCVPARQAAVFHRATARNQLHLPDGTAIPLLAGPVLLTRADGTCVGTGSIPYVAPGERFELSFGSEDDVVVRHRHGRRTEARFARADRTWFTSTTTLTSLSDKPVELVVLDRVPVSDLPEVTVHVAPSATDQPTRTGPDDHGHVRWTVCVQPGATVVCELAFAIDKPDRVTLPDPW